MFLEVIVKLIPILGSVDLLDVIQSVDISPGKDANNVVDPVRSRILVFSGFLVLSRISVLSRILVLSGEFCQA